MHVPASRNLPALFVAFAATCGAYPASAGPPGEPAFELAPVVVKSHRQFPGVTLEHPLATVWRRAAIQRVTPLTIDSVLAREPVFSLYRRETGAFAHPTTQGANLRGLGANAASRALVLLDGVPQNDAFGGWVPWARFAPVSVETAEVLPSTRAAVWGNLSAGGVVALTAPDVFETHQRYQMSMGNLGYRDASVLRSVASEQWGMALSGRILRRDGDYLVHPADRGPIDRRADLDVESLSLRGGWRPAESLTIEPSWSYFSEERGNGSPLAQNRMRGWDVGLRTSGEAAGWSWQALAYHQQREMENQFTALNDERTGETPVLDQFGIPSETTGGSFVVETGLRDSVRVLFGADLRRMQGRTHEDYGFGLQNRRTAGGEQRLGGIFGKGLWTLQDEHFLAATLRLDRWTLSDAFLRERPLSDAHYSVDRNFADRDDFEPSAALRWEWQFDPRWRFQAGVSHAFRLPTINELYRPYRVGSDIFDANPQLNPERFTTLELGFSGRMSEQLHLETGVFLSRVENVIANVFIRGGPGESPGGAIPPDGSYNRRENVDTSRVWGWQSRLSWSPLEMITVEVRHRWLQSTFRRSGLQPALEGRRFPQVPRHQGNVEVRYLPTARWTLFAVLSGSTAQYDDPLNQRRIKGYTRADLGFLWSVHPGWTLVGRIGNLGDELILTGIASDGERAIATGRAAWLTLRAEF